MQKIAKFEKVSITEFLKCGSKETFDGVILPRRATAGSAGYDFFSPVTFTLEPGETAKIATGVRVKIADGWVLMIYPRSSIGFKYQVGLANTTGIIDSDYYASDNEGHIFAKLTNDTKENKSLRIEVGQGFMQGIFVEYGITVDDEVIETRNGGFGSTTK